MTGEEAREKISEEITQYADAWIAYARRIGNAIYPSGVPGSQEVQEMMTDEERVSEALTRAAIDEQGRARTDLRVLAAEVERLRAENAALREIAQTVAYKWPGLDMSNYQIGMFISDLRIRARELLASDSEK